MKKLAVAALTTVGLTLGLAAVSLAAEVDPAIQVTGLKVFMYTVIFAACAIGFAAVGCGLAQALAVKSAVEGTARNPEASGKITVTMLIGLAMIESLCIYALVVALILLYAYPMATPVAKFIGML